MSYQKPLVIGVMGSGADALPQEIVNAHEMGKIIAERGWITLTGGSSLGVMHSALFGAKELNPHSTTIAILSQRGEAEKTSQCADVCIPTGMGEGRNNLNIVSSDFIFFCCDNPWKDPGTFSELCFAIKHKKPFLAVCSAAAGLNIWKEILKNFGTTDNFQGVIWGSGVQNEAKNLLDRWHKRKPWLLLP